MWYPLHDDLAGETVGDQFGNSCAISADGSRLIVGAYHYLDYTEQVRVYRDNGSMWEQVHTPFNGDATYEQFGTSVGMSKDGLQIIICADENDTGFGKDQVFIDDGSSWVQVGPDILS